MKHEKTPGKGLSGKLVALLLALTLVIGCVAGGTVAWLTAKTKPVVNTFTFGNINITLSETTENYKITPGVPIHKDPKVAVDANSEDCWLFVKIDEANWLSELKYEKGEGWDELTNSDFTDGTTIPAGTKVIYRKVLATDATREFSVLSNDQVTVEDTLTKDQVDDVTQNPTLTFTAYAVQYESFEDDLAGAWAQANSNN